MLFLDAQPWIGGRSGKLCRNLVSAGLKLSIVVFLVSSGGMEFQSLEARILKELSYCEVYFILASLLMLGMLTLMPLLSLVEKVRPMSLGIISFRILKIN